MTNLLAHFVKQLRSRPDTPAGQTTDRRVDAREPRRVRGHRPPSSLCTAPLYLGARPARWALRPLIIACGDAGRPCGCADLDAPARRGSLINDRRTTIYVHLAAVPALHHRARITQDQVHAHAPPSLSVDVSRSHEGMGGEHVDADGVTQKPSESCNGVRAPFAGRRPRTRRAAAQAVASACAC